MIVKDFMVSNKKVFIDQLIRELIRYEISFVCVDDEVHFLDYIYRFKDMNINLDKMNSFCELILIDQNKLPNLKNFIEVLEPVIIKEDDFKLSSFNDNKFNKNMFKNNNRLTNQKIKSYIKNRKY